MYIFLCSSHFSIFYIIQQFHCLQFHVNIVIFHLFDLIYNFMYSFQSSPFLIMYNYREDFTIHYIFSMSKFFIIYIFSIEYIIFTKTKFKNKSLVDNREVLAYFVYCLQFFCFYNTLIMYLIIKFDISSKYIFLLFFNNNYKAHILVPRYQVKIKSYTIR